MAKLKPYLILPFVLFAFACKGQVYFNNTYSSGLPDSAFRGETIRSIVEYEKDSTYVINLVSQNVTNGELVTIFTKLNYQGVPILSKQYGYPNHYFLGFKLIKLKDGNMLSCGQDFDNSIAYSKAILLKLNTQLDTIWKREYIGNGTFNYAIVDVIETYNNGYIGIGFSSNAIDTMDIWLLRTDSLGNQLWDTTLTQPYWQNGYAIAATDDSCYILGCMAQNAPGGPPTNIYIAKINDNKKMLWSKYVSNNGAVGLTNLFSLKDGNYLASGAVNKGWGSGWNDFYGVLLKFDDAGNIIKYKTYDKTKKQTEFWNSIENSDGSIISAGNIYDTLPGNNEADGYIVKLDSLLDTIWTQTIKIDSLGEVDYFFNIARTHDGGFACTGMRIGTIPYNTDGWVIKFDSLGCQSANCWLGINESTYNKMELPFVYPNPTTDFCIVRFIHQGPVQVEVFDDIGRQIKNVRALPFGDTDVHIDLRQAPSGMLLIRLKNGAKILSTKIIKK